METISSINNNDTPVKDELDYENSNVVGQIPKELIETHPATVSYKRYKKNLLLQPEISSLLDKLQKQNNVYIHDQYNSTFLNNLEKEKLIYFDYLEEFL